MGSIYSNNSSSKNRLFGAYHSNQTCNRTHQIGALALIVVTFFITRLFDQYYFYCSFSSSSTLNGQYRSKDDVLRFSNDGNFINWPHRGYGSHLSLKIFVYDEHEIDGLDQLMRGRDGKISAETCLKGQWGTQVKIHRMLLQSRFRTRKKEEADLFFVPTYVKCVRMSGGLNDKEINQTYVKVLSQMPYFTLSGGRNHIFVFPSGAGAHLFKSWATYLNRSIILTPEGDRTDKRDTSAFNTWKDIIIPGNVDDGMTTHGARLVKPLPLSKRKYLANFLGRVQGKLGRLQLIDLSKKFSDKLESPELKFSGPDKLGKIEYFQHLRNAKFCLAPRGESSWTLRFYESFFVVSLPLSLSLTHSSCLTQTYKHFRLVQPMYPFAIQECVPVILSDQVELPFQNVVDYTQISIKWPSTRIGPQLLEYLESISDKEIEEIIARGRKVRCLWVYSPESDCSAFNGILWELQRKVRQFHQSAETFWLHNGTVVNRNLVEFNKWKPPMSLP